MAALFDFPELSLTDKSYSIHNDVDHCVETVTDALEPQQLEELRALVGQTILDPTRDRTGLLAFVFTEVSGLEDASAAEERSSVAG